MPLLLLSLITESSFELILFHKRKQLTSLYIKDAVFITSFLHYFLPQVLQNNAKYQVVPKKLTIGKRLAQCLHPALPSGVHRKALETYEIIFKIIGPKRLAKDLFLYR